MGVFYDLTPDPSPKERGNSQWKGGYFIAVIQNISIFASLKKN